MSAVVTVGIVAEDEYTFKLLFCIVKKLQGIKVNPLFTICMSVFIELKYLNTINAYFSVISHISMNIFQSMP